MNNNEPNSDKLERLFKESFEDFAPESPPQVWQNLQNSLGAKPSPGFFSGNRIKILAAGLTGVMVAACIWYFYADRSEIHTSNPDQTNQIKTDTFLLMEDKIVPTKTKEVSTQESEGTEKRKTIRFTQLDKEKKTDSITVSLPKATNVRIHPVKGDSIVPGTPLFVPDNK